MTEPIDVPRPKERRPLSTVEVVETMRQFKELYAAISAGDTDRALQLYQEISPEITEVLEGLFEGPNSIVPEEERNQIEQGFQQIKGTKVDLISRVKLALEGTDSPKEHIKSRLKNFLKVFELDPTEALRHLSHVHGFMFPSNGDAPFEPEALSPEFVDFLDDAGMWEWIAKKEQNGLTEADQEALHMVYDSVKDLVERDALFSDIAVEEESESLLEQV